MTEMELMAECARLHQSQLPSREREERLGQLAKNWLETHDELPKWW